MSQEFNLVEQKRDWLNLLVLTGAPWPGRLIPHVTRDLGSKPGGGKNWPALTFSANSDFQLPAVSWMPGRSVKFFHVRLLLLYTSSSNLTNISSELHVKDWLLDTLTALSQNLLPVLVSLQG